MLDVCVRGVGLVHKPVRTVVTLQLFTAMAMDSTSKSPRLFTLLDVRISCVTAGDVVAAVHAPEAGVCFRRDILDNAYGCRVNVKIVRGGYIIY